MQFHYCNFIFDFYILLIRILFSSDIEIEIKATSFKIQIFTLDIVKFDFCLELYKVKYVENLLFFYIDCYNQISRI